ncbi:MFS transporter [Litchfieldia salsa]|uniref:Na+/melibiose symporter n=1 Tax=Litchfieldia salsa TaxID=930152 RepID=A0A1H0VM97_9BACI|nr:MFS transporter [Litchfieldia salsa]SDP79338.1 Na+/melibiose symporter [Litchfieldia salsa]
MQKEPNLSAKEKRASENAEREIKYNRANIWQMALYPIGSVGQNSFMFLMMLVSFYATGIVGLGTVVASTIITGTRIFDSITDPIIGVVIDKTNGKFGKVRPFFCIGYLMLALSVLVMFYTAHTVPEGIRMVYFSFLYIIYIIGYTLVGVANSAGLALLTNDPSQRPIIGGFQVIYSTTFFALGSIYLAKFLAPKYGGFSNPGLFQDFAITVAIFAAVTYTLATIAIWSKDRIENFGAGKLETISFRDMWPILKGNRPLQMFILAATTDKLSLQIAGNQIVNLMLFGIIIGNYGIFGTLSAIALIPNILVILFGIRYAAKFGTKKGFVMATWGCIISFTAMFFLLWLGDPAQIGSGSLNFMTIAFVTLFLIGGGVRYLSSGLVMPMIPDIIDYETYRSDRFAPGIVSTTYSFVDKMVSSLAQTVVGIMLAMIGFKASLPDIDTPYSESIFWVTMVLYIGFLMIAWIASLVAMKFYELDFKKMMEIQEELQSRRK